MLLYLFYPLYTKIAVFNVFKYITFRTFGAAITSVLLCMLIGPAFIKFLQKKQIGQSIRDDGPRSHYTKQGTPTMGGGLILLAVLLPTLLWADLTNKKVWIALITTLLFGLVGYFDDYRKVVLKNSKGLRVKQKLFFQILIALVASLAIFYFGEVSHVLKFPFFKGMALDLGWFFVPFSIVVIVGCSNAVNLTDGLDGLAVGPVMTTSATFLLLAYCAGHQKIATYLQIPFVSGAGELSVFLASVWASCLGFLWFNTYPAQVFMGDVGSLPLGAALGVVAVITKNEILLVICGGIFVAEALSVIAQVISFKLTGRRVLKMAPIHHHFELKGWPEQKIVIRFWIISILLALFTLSTLKLR
ncbi:MAG: phospho-N-acetylmuramoyl-pentapeptide-transferase [Bdellovibrio sp.]|nr:phospho-N-acetylmuramoyl-pentapeptide-transferase [Bdellovibrio sp.]